MINFEDVKILKLMDMKRFLNRLFCVLAVAGMGMFAAGCSVEDGDKEQEEEVTAAGLVGTWKWDVWGLEGVMDAYGKSYFQFRADGRMAIVSIDNESGEVEKGICLWELSGEEIVLRESEAEGAATQILGPITELTEDNMTIVIEGFPITWRRVADSEIEEYLE